MELHEAIALISTPEIISNKPLVCADLGCGSGLFTHALATMLHGGSTIYAVDKTVSLKSTISPGNVTITAVEADFEKEELPFNNLDGIIMANALHYVKDKSTFIDRLKKLMTPEAFFLVVEYDTDKPVGRWVPYPVSYAQLQMLFQKEGCQHIHKLHTRPSLYGNGNLYSSLILP